MKGSFILILFLIPLCTFAGTMSRNGLNFHWDYTLSPETYHRAEVEKIISSNTLQIQYQGTSHIMYLTGELNPVSFSSPGLNADYSKEGKDFLEKMCPVGSSIYITFSSEKIDSNGIAHGYIWYKSGESWILHNLSAIANGYAIADRTGVYRNDYQDLFATAENTAKNNIRGIWKSVFDNSGNVVISTSSGPIRINSVKFTGEGKYIEIANTENTRVDLNGWKLISASDGKTYQFGPYLLKGGKKIRIYTETHGEDLVWDGLELYYYLSNKIYLLNTKGIRTSVYGW
ncbi:MAG TPA: lamin tail domain-containing protein [Thermotogota bacterium]|nr:lamin tail domain-containing protein [Thermotogota bacterium]